MSEPLKNSRKTAEALGLSPSQISELLKAGAITAEIHEGSLIRFDVEKVRTQLRERAEKRARDASGGGETKVPTY